MDPRSVGVPESRLILGKHSGRHALNQRCASLGYTLSKAELDGVYERFITLADRKKGVLKRGDCGDSRRAPGGRGRGGIALGA